MNWSEENWNWVEWPHKDNGPLWIGVHWRLLDGRWECVGLKIEFAPGARVRPLRTKDLRGINLGGLIERAAREFTLDLQETYRDPHDDGPFGALVDDLIEKVPKGRPPVPLARLQETAKVYRDAYAKRLPPTKAVQEHFGVPYGTAGRWVAQCRERGLLGRTRQGRAGGTMPPPREERR